MVFFKDIQKKSSNLYGTTKHTTAKAIPRGVIRLPDFKLHYKVTIIKTESCWQKNTDQWNQTESPEINSHIYGQLIFVKGAKNIQWRKESLFSKWCRESWKATSKRLKLDCYLMSYTKINSKWNTELKTRPETTTYIEENAAAKLTDLGLREDCINLTPKARK